MSFILDALKKSESDRQRQNGPALYEVKVAAPRTQLPLWAIGLAALLAINLGLVAWALLRRSTDAPAATARNSGAAASQAASAPNAGQPLQAGPAQGPNPGPGGGPYSGQNGSGQNGYGQNGGGQPGAYAQNGAQPGAYGQGGGYSPSGTNGPGGPNGGGNAGGYGGPGGPGGPQQPGGYGPNYGPNNGPNGAQNYSQNYGQSGNGGNAGPWQGPNAPNGGSTTAAPGPNGAQPPQAPPQGLQPAQGQSAQAAAGNPDDYAPATDPAPASMANGFHARRGLEGGMQLYSDAEGSNGLPELRLDLLTYSQNPRERFVLINMKTLHEGEMVAAGIRVDSITSDGVILSRNGAKYLLAPR
jgi:hypothetical protein